MPSSRQVLPAFPRKLDPGAWVDIVVLTSVSCDHPVPLGWFSLLVRGCSRPPPAAPTITSCSVVGLLCTAPDLNSSSDRE